MVKKKAPSTQPDIDQYSLFTNLLAYYERNKGMIKKKYRRVTKVYLDYNEDGYLREPQFKALEIYVFMKEFFENKKVFDVFTNLYEEEELAISTTQGKQGLFNFVEDEQKLFDGYYKDLKKQLEQLKRNYPDYVFALTMGTGKTILMATTIFYEFILANKFPKDKLYAHNALVFAPDRTVLESLREIIIFDKSLVIPPEYRNFINSEIKFHFLADTSTQLNTLDGSDFNIIITNQQKISLQEKATEVSAVKKLMDSDVLSILEDMDAMLDLDNVVLIDDKYLTKNQRFEKLLRLDNLAIYVDEAHHAFGTTLEGSMKKLKASIDAISEQTTVVGCYNFTGTPYVNNKLIPEVVYAYSLKDAIGKKYLKNPIVKAYDNVGEVDFVKEVITDFWTKFSGKRFENMLPKIAFFAPNIDILENNLKPALEAVLDELNIDTSKILVNVGDPKLTTNDDIREFINLDTAASEKQFILLVNKGQEGWNCRSLFSTALYRKPQSKIFVLQATMRCLRSVEPAQLNGHIYLSSENEQILASELEANFNMKLENFGNKDASDKEIITLRVKLPLEKLKIKRVQRTYELKEKVLAKDGIAFGLNMLDTHRYLATVTTMDGLKNLGNHTYREDIKKHQTSYSIMMLVSLCSAYIGKPSLLIEKLLETSEDGIDLILKMINEHNEILYDVIIPKLFNHFWDLEEKQTSYEQEISLVNEPPEGQEGFKCVTASLEKVVESFDIENASKSFHYSPYCFDSNPEMTFFKKAMKDEKEIKRVFFMGQLTHGQSDFYVSYIDPESHTVRKYYPDFLVQKFDDSWVMVEIKGEDKLNDVVVQAKKKYAEDMAEHSSFSYLFVPSQKAMDLSINSILKL